MRSPARNSAASVIPDDRQGAHIAVEHWPQLGHRRIAHIAGSSDISRGAYRPEGSRGGLSGDSNLWGLEVQRVLDAVSVSTEAGNWVSIG